jgi:hypothetical protein
MQRISILGPVIVNWQEMSKIIEQILQCFNCCPDPFDFFIVIVVTVSQRPALIDRQVEPSLFFLFLFLLK